MKGNLLNVGFVTLVVSAIAGSNGVAAPPIAIELELVADGLTAPITLTHAGDGSGRLFIADQAGQIHIVDNGVLRATPFLDISSKLPTLGGFFDERGLLGFAFHPDYANNGRFFVRYSAPRPSGPNEPCATAGFIPGCHAEVLAEYSVSVGDPDIADPSSEIILFSVNEPEFNHDGGSVGFGPDGLLYFSLGDGGGANDDLHLNGLCDAGTCVGDGSVCSVFAQDCADLTTCASDSGPCSIPTTPTCGDGSDCLPAAILPHTNTGNGQNTDTPLGSLLRIDVDGPPDPGLPYAIPPGNPFAGGGGVPEIYAYGFRNPFSFEFDDGPGGDGSMYLGDVGQNLFEEVNIIPIVAAPGLLNHGWVIREGRHCFDPFSPDDPPAVCAATGPFGEPLIDPVMEYLQPFGCAMDSDCASLGVGCDETLGLCENEGGISVIGGHVYRGAQNPVLDGIYVFGDFSDQFGVPGGRLYYFDTQGPDAFSRQQFCLAPDDAPLGKFLKGHGEDEDGELYVLVSEALAPTGDTGAVFRIVNASDDDCNTNGIPDACETDSDGDGVIDDCDGCPVDPGKSDAGVCGCGVADDDSDNDGTPDCIDGCPFDPAKIAPGICGCGVSDVDDTDGDGTSDCVDVCPGVDDGVFGNPACSGNGDSCVENGDCPAGETCQPACQSAIPTVSSWGIVVMSLLLLVVAKVSYRRVPEAL